MHHHSRRKVAPVLWLTAVVLAAAASIPAVAAEPTPARSGARQAIEYVREFDIKALRLAIDDLGKTFQDKYESAAKYTARLDELSQRRQRILASLETGDKSARGECGALGFELNRLKREALTANPLLDFNRLILLKRKRGQAGLPTNHQCNPCLPRTGYDNEIAVMSPWFKKGSGTVAGTARGVLRTTVPDPFLNHGGMWPVRPNEPLETLFRPKDDFFVGEIDLNFDADRLLFTMPNGRTWEIHEIDIDGGNLRQVSRQVEAVDNFDACYLPDGRITFASTASFTGVPCWHGKERACSLYLMNPDGSGVRQLCFDQDLDLHPSVLPSGQVIYSRWDYTTCTATRPNGR